jgi:penicillin-binding protein 2
MAGTDRLRDHEREAWLFRRRAIVAGAGAAVIVVILLVRLLHLQYLSHEHYTTLSNDNRVRIEATAPTRGLIHDRNGTVLAENLPSFSLELVPERVDDLDATLEALRPLVAFDARDVERLKDAWRHARPFEGVALRFQLDPEEVARFSVQRHRFPGVDIVAGLTRHYPYASTGVHALGYVGRIDEADLERLDESQYRATSHVGKLGVEHALEHLLHGDPGFRRVEVNVQGRVLRVLEEQAPVPGKDVFLTLDLELQRLAERLLGPRDGAVVALDPRNGEVIALASTPTFDPNLFVNGIGREAYARLRDSPHRPLFNRAIKGQYPPGSTIKPMVALNGLEADVQQREDEIHCRGYYRLEGRGRRFRDWKAHGTVDLADSVAQSCDVMFYDLALRLGMEQMASFLRRFGLGQPTGIDIPGERGGLIPDPQWKRRARGETWYTGETLIHGIGQGYMQTTPVQLATAAAMLANRGRPVRPHVFLRASGPGEETREPREPVIPPLELSLESDWDYIIDSMVAVTEGERGTARSIGWKSPHTIAGKTGTSQVFGLGQDEEYVEEEVALELRDHALFISFAPAADPRIAVAVVVENGGSGSAAAAPIAQQVIDAWLGPEPLPSDRAPEAADGDA